MAVKVCLYSLLSKNSEKCIDIAKEEGLSDEELNLSLEKALYFITETEKIRDKIRKESNNVPVDRESATVE